MMEASTKARPSPAARRHSSPPTPRDEPDSAISWQQALAFLLTASAGSALALWLLPTWLPALFSDIAARQAYWHLARSSGLIAYLLLWLSAALGLLITNRLARAWPGGPTAFDLHQFTSLLALAFVAFHAIILLGDTFIGYTLTQILIPFAATGYQPLATGLGQIAFYLALVISFSFYIRKHIGRRAWRLLHYTSFLVFGLITLHGMTAGSDATTLWPMYLASFGSILFLTLYRILISHTQKPTPHPRSPR